MSCPNQTTLCCFNIMCASDPSYHLCTLTFHHLSVFSSGVCSPLMLFLIQCVKFKLDVFSLSSHFFVLFCLCCLTLPWISYLTLSVMVLHLSSLTEKQRRSCHHKLLFLMWLPLPGTPLFPLEKPCEPFKAYFIYHVSNIFPDFIFPTIEELFTHL